MRVLVTGGAGYIGSVVTEELISQGHDAVVYDNLGKGHIQAIGEQVPGFEGTVNWFSVIGPPKMPRNVVATLNKAINAAIQQPDLKKRLNDGGQEVIGGTPEQLRTLVARETERKTRAAKLVGMQPQ